MKRELKCGHCAETAHDRLPARLRQFCEKSAPKANAMTNRQLLQRTEVAAELQHDYLNGRLKIQYCPTGSLESDPSSEGHLYEVTTDIDQEWHWYACFDDRKDLRLQIAGWARHVASWFIGLADDVEEIPETKANEVAFYDVVSADGEVMFRSFCCKTATGVRDEMAKKGLAGRVMERTVKLPAGIEVTP